MCSLVSSWTLKTFCRNNGINPENLSDFRDAIDRMMEPKKIKPDEQNKLCPVVVKGSYAYHLSQSSTDFPLFRIHQVDPNYAWPTVYDPEKLGNAESIELWENPGSLHPNMVAQIIGQPKVNNEYFCLTKYSIFFELPTEQVSYFTHFLRTESPKIGYLLGVNE